VSSLLEVRGLTVCYGLAPALQNIDLRVDEGEFVAVVGSNGAGKSTLLRAVSGLLTAAGGEIRFRGERIDGTAPERVAALGIAHVPEGRRVFPDQTTEDNLWLGAYRRLRREPRATIARDLDGFFHRFPNLAARRRSPAGLLSGGEQQMLAIARALIGRPSLLMLDEPSLGLAPSIIRSVFALLRQEREAGTTILLVEQLAYAALSASDRAYVLERGAVRTAGPSATLMHDEHVRAAYLGNTQHTHG
jgi:branched-chain amino acid transport system ATP-binding protein